MDSAYSLPQRVIAEFFGTAALLIAIIGSGMMASQLAAGLLALILMANALATGMALHVFILIWGPVSGGHFNPAVTMVMIVRREMDMPSAFAYIAAQIAGGILGVLAVHAMFESPLWQLSQTVRAGNGQFLAEFIATFGLITTILFIRHWNPKLLAGAVGTYITAAIWFTASTSFANPAVTLARAFSDSFTGIALSNVGLFIIAQLLGAFAAALYFSWQTREN